MIPDPFESVYGIALITVILSFTALLGAYWYGRFDMVNIIGDFAAPLGYLTFGLGALYFCVILDRLQVNTILSGVLVVTYVILIAVGGLKANRKGEAAKYASL